MNLNDLAPKSEKKSDFDPVSEGTHAARLLSVVGIGTSYSEKYDKTNNQIILTFEVPGETVEITWDPRPSVVSVDH